MKKIYLSFILITSVFCLNGQTRQETESWILNKLKIYNNNSGEIDFQLDGSTLKIHFKWNSSTDKETFYIVPVWSIESVALSNNNLTFYMSKYCKSCKRIVYGRKQKYRTEYYTVTKYGWGKGEQISWQEEKSKRVPDGYTNYQDEKYEITSVSVSFKNNDPEEDFINRFNKAIDHLQTLYPKKPARQETF